MSCDVTPRGHMQRPRSLPSFSYHPFRTTDDFEFAPQNLADVCRPSPQTPTNYTKMLIIGIHIYLQGELEKMSLFKTAIMSFMKEQFHFIHPYHL